MDISDFYSYLPADEIKLFTDFGILSMDPEPTDRQPPLKLPVRDDGGISAAIVNAHQFDNPSQHSRKMEQLSAPLDTTASTLASDNQCSEAPDGQHRLLGLECICGALDGLAYECLNGCDYEFHDHVCLSTRNSAYVAKCYHEWPQYDSVAFAHPECRNPTYTGMICACGASHVRCETCGAHHWQIPCVCK